MVDLSPDSMFEFADRMLNDEDLAIEYSWN
jgi:hypothetical protein